MVMDGINYSLKQIFEESVSVSRKTYVKRERQRWRDVEREIKRYEEREREMKWERYVLCQYEGESVEKIVIDGCEEG